MKKILSVLLCVLLSVAALAQSANMMSMARAELSKRGLNETEVRARLLENGIDVDSISPADYPAYQDRVLSILNEMQAEKAAKASGNAGGGEGAASTAEGTAESPAVAPTVSSADIAQTTMGEAAAEQALEKTLEQNNVSPTAGNDIYGHSLFTGKTLDVYRTTDGAQAPDSYVLGEGDEIHISIFGSSQTEIHQRVSPDGSIQPAGSTKIFLKGLTLAQARAAVKTKLSQHYSFRPDQIAVTISTARTLNVNIYGEVGVQGGFTISALNTVFNALAAAGGPSAQGSVRNIQLSRGGKTHTLDLYKYMMNPTDGSYYDLQNNDVLFVPMSQKVVDIQGAVKRPMRYELVEGETLVDLIHYAGGLKENAYTDYMQIDRFVNNQPQLLEFKLSDIMAGRQIVNMLPGDVVTIKEANAPLEDYVNISGDVYYPGRYNLENNTSLITLLESAKPRYTARTDIVIVERTRPDETLEVFTIPFPGINGNPDFKLEARDSVSVLEQSSYRDVATIAVNGQVRRPFSRNFGLNDRMTVTQAIELAGGVKPSVYPVAYIFRKDITNPDKMQYIPVNLEKDGEQLLQPGDNLNVYDNTTYTNIGEVRISGAVKNPTSVTFDSGLTLHDMFAMAGGMEMGASFDRVQIFRMDVSKSDEAKFYDITVAVDDNYNCTDPNFQLQPYDHIVARMTPNFTKGRTVEINGRVKYPGTYVLSDDLTQLSTVIAQAGGLLDDAEPDAILFRAFNGRGNIGLDLDKMRSNKGNEKYDPILMDGDVINVLRHENTVAIRETGTRIGQFIPTDFAATHKTVTYQGPHNAKWYIEHNAGGFDKYADRNSVTVTKPNGESLSTRRFLWMRIYPKVEPGSTISLKMNTEKREKDQKPKERVEWDKIAAGTLSSLTSIVSMILLIERLN